MKHLNLFFKTIFNVSFCFFVMALFSSGLLAQGNPTELPNVIPPSPTVANLMSFEEVPVSNYTGQPNISIPLYSKALNSELGINIALSYNTQGIKINSRSSWVGTGWSLEAGGVISRTVRGFPDEKPKGDAYFSGPSKAKGVFHNNDFWNYNDPNTVNQAEFAWNSNGTNDEQYDFQSDLFQFNALGINGRFVIVKENGVLVAKLLTKNQNIKIEIDYGTPGVGENEFSLNSFTIIDTKGNHYTFDQTEDIYSEPFIAAQDFGGNISFQGAGTQGHTTNAWYLSKIETSSAVELARFEYSIVQEDYQDPVNRTYREITDNTMPPTWGAMIQNSYNLSILPSNKTVAYNTNEAQTQKLSKIIFRDSTRVHFNALGSHPETGGAKLKEIIIYKDENLVEDKRFTFNFDNDPTLDRLWLIELQEKGGSIIHPYTFEYIEKDELPPFDSPSDDWGYTNGMSNLTFDSNCTAADPFDKQAIQKGLLNKIVYPTGGVKEFVFEHNRITYQSYTGTLNPLDIASPLTDQEFKELNADNWILGSGGSFTFNTDFDNCLITPTPIQTLSISQTGDVIFNIGNVSVDLSGCNGSNDTVESVLFNSLINITETGTNNNIGNIRLDRLDQKELIFNLTAGSYDISICNLTPCAQVTLDICYNYLTYEQDISRFIYGGGVRIKEILFKNNSNSEPERKQMFSYKDINDFSMSSGAIDGDVNGINLSYIESTSNHLFKYSNTCVTQEVEIKNLSFNIYTKGMKVELTQGHYVGYKHVSVFQQDGGLIRYEFTSAQDFANNLNVFHYPFSPPKNLDFKRGLLLKKQIFKNNPHYLEGTEPSGKLLEIVNTYDYELDIVAPSFKLYDEDCPWTMYYNSYNNYLNNSQADNPMEQCEGFGSGCDGNCFANYSHCSDTPYFLRPNPVESGWAKLKEIQTTEYYYDDQDNQTSKESFQTFTYNDDNFQIKEKLIKYTEGDNIQELKTKYYYPVGEAPPYGYDPLLFSDMTNINKINEVVATESFRGNDLLSQSFTKYFEPQTNQFLPLEVKVNKANNTPETRIEFKKYDDYGNLLEVIKTNGIHVSYIWGYNNTFPVAKIENTTYSNIEALSSFGPNFHLGNSGLTSTQESEVRTLLPNSMVSTYEYEPLTGITSMTDPKGYTVTYEYDELNRLKHVKDQDGNILSKNEYRYRTQD